MGQGPICNNQTCCRDDELAEPTIIIQSHCSVEDSPLARPASEQKKPVLELALKKADGNIVTMTISKQPLAFDFTRESPIVIKKVQAGGQAEALGMKVGMVLMAINGEDLSDLDFNDQYSLLKMKALKLPKQDADPDDAAMGA